MDEIKAKVISDSYMSQPQINAVQSNIDMRICFINNKSTQRVYNTFEKDQTLAPPPLPSPLSPILLFLLAQLSFLFIRKWERILPCLVASCIGVYSLSVDPLSSLPSHFSLSFSFPSVSYVLSACGGNFFSERTIRRAFHVKIATNVTTNRYMWHYDIVDNSAGNKSLI